ncbi:MAG: heavy-metal-associated domain-containing protein [Flavobacteriales bacterium]|nr:heavy-metal-associated domain-containing protein [Flavobacteriales bacterium]
MPSTDIILEVDGMTCGHCARAVKELAEEVAGVSSANVNLGTKEVSISVSGKVSSQSIIDNINSSDTYKARLK